MGKTFPRTQRDLVRLARGAKSQREFATELGVDRSGVWRYEREELGVSPRVLNHCLQAVAESLSSDPAPDPLNKALAHVQQAEEALRVLSETRSGRARRSRSRE